MPPDTCDWNPEAKRKAEVGGPCQHNAVMVVGSDGKWHLCYCCSELPEFNRFKKRIWNAPESEMNCPQDKGYTLRTDNYMTEEIDPFAALDSEPEQPQEREIIGPPDEELQAQFFEIQDYLMCPPADARAEDMGTAEHSYSHIILEMVARGIIESKESRNLDRMRPCGQEDYDRLVDALLQAGYYENRGDATFYVNTRLNQAGCPDPKEMEWPHYNNVQAIVAELCYQARLRDKDAKKTRTRKPRGSSGGAKNANKATEQSTSPSDAIANEQSTEEQPATDSQGDQTSEDAIHNRYAFIEHLDDWAAYEGEKGEELTDEERPGSGHYQAILEWFSGHTTELQGRPAQRISDWNFTKEAAEECATAILDSMGKTPKTAFTWNQLATIARKMAQVGHKTPPREEFIEQMAAELAPPAEQPAAYRVDADGQVFDLPAALRIIGLTEPPDHKADPGTERGEHIVNAALRIMHIWQTEIDILKTQLERRIKPLSEKIQWIDTTFSAFIDLDAKQRIEQKNKKKDGTISPTYAKGKYWDYDYGRVSYGVAGGAEVVHGPYEKLIETIGTLNATEGVTQEELGQLFVDRAEYESDEEYEAGCRAAYHRFLPLINAVQSKTVYTVDKKLVEKLVEDDKLPIPGTLMKPVQPLGGPRKIEGVKAK